MALSTANNNMQRERKNGSVTTLGCTEKQIADLRAFEDEFAAASSGRDSVDSSKKPPGTALLTVMSDCSVLAAPERTGIIKNVTLVDHIDRIYDVKEVHM